MTPRDIFTLEGVSVLITGTTGGLGAHMAHVLAAAGAHVALGGRRQEPLDDLVARLSALGNRAIAVAFDVTDADAVDSALATAEQVLGPITLLVNNSGVTATAAVTDLDEAIWDQIVDTNLKGAWLCSRAFARRLIALGQPGTIVNTASILGIRQAGQVAAYAASKAGLIQLTKTMALELARHDIRVNALAPGYFATALNEQFLATPAGQALIKRVPQRRLGTLEDLDGPLLLLASNASRFITGAILPVDGGHLVSTL